MPARREPQAARSQNLPRQKPFRKLFNQQALQRAGRQAGAIIAERTRMAIEGEQLAERSEHLAFGWRQVKEEGELKRAFENLARFYKNPQNGKRPATGVGVKIKQVILQHIFEAKIKSFGELLEFLKKNGLYRNEGEFLRLYDSLFDRKEKLLLQKLFPLKRESHNQLFILRYLYSRQ
ncbi:MAG: hypothetical protein HYW50_00625 [Candidatus Diapherotrites archaeon]|nr:hypothetical protein [Candidatus Diapherotrites archaeon]